MREGGRRWVDGGGSGKRKSEVRGEGQTMYVVQTIVQRPSDFLASCMSQELANPKNVLEIRDVIHLLCVCYV